MRRPTPPARCRRGPLHRATGAPIGGCWSAAAALLAVTLGIYRFWLATDVRRFLWSNTEIAGETLEYTGTANELLIGFLIAHRAAGAALVGCCSSAALSLGPVGQFVSTLSFPLLFFLGQFAVYRARRYRLTRTIYRGVRCHQDGSALRYAVCAVFWWVLIVLTLGLAYPFAQAQPRTLQDAAHLLRQSAGPLRRARACGCSCAACRCGCW